MRRCLPSARPSRRPRPRPLRSARRSSPRATGQVVARPRRSFGRPPRSPLPTRKGWPRLHRRSTRLRRRATLGVRARPSRLRPTWLTWSQMFPLSRARRARTPTGGLRPRPCVSVFFPPPPVVPECDYDDEDDLGSLALQRDAELEVIHIPDTVEPELFNNTTDESVLISHLVVGPASPELGTLAEECEGSSPTPAPAESSPGVEAFLDDSIPRGRHTTLSSRLLRRSHFPSRKRGRRWMTKMRFSWPPDRLFRTRNPSPKLRWRRPFRRRRFGRRQRHVVARPPRVRRVLCRATTTLPHLARARRRRSLVCTR